MAEKDKKRNTKAKQAQLPLSGMGSPAAKLPATALMKKVAEKAPHVEKMRKAFSKGEINEILARVDGGEIISTEERALLREKYRKIKRQVKEMEAGNQSKVIAFPSLTNGQGWYKVVEFSALYYVYRLADRMGRKARVYKDTDKFLKCLYSATFQNIDEFRAQFEELAQPTLEITKDGVYIFTLKTPLTDDEVGMLRRVEATRREKLHNILRPKEMSPATYQAILMVMRQVTPKVRKLQKQYYFTTGEGMVKDIQLMLALYFDFANGISDRAETGREILKAIDRLFAGLSLLAETQVWPYDVSLMIGENINNVRRLAVKDFGIKMRE